jgi:hypothetical protein
MGIDWWEWVDKVVGGENMNFGLVTIRDNAYDGKEAVATNGERQDHGDFMTAVAAANQAVVTVLRTQLLDTLKRGQRP